MTRTSKLIAGAAFTVALIEAGTGMALSCSNDESDDGGPLSGTTHDRAEVTALDATTDRRGGNGD
ncbi:MAG TPA: hypothetical protein VFG94_11155 [Acidimicrobiales bacterium]|nr:hypothetical protein [Acidimicrobiales bacterium]